MNTTNAERRANFKTAWEAGVDPVIMADRFGITRSAVYDAARRWGLNARKCYFKWTPERKALAVRLYEQGISATEISKMMTVPGELFPTRNAVLGQVHRIKGKGNGRGRASAPPAPKARPLPKVAPAPVDKVAKPAAFKTANGRVYPQQPAKPLPPRLVIGGHGAVAIHEQREPVVPPPKAHAFVALPGTTPKPFGAHRAHFCKWPIHDPADTDDIARLSCGEPCEGRYCKAHATLSAAPYQPKPLRDLPDPMVSRNRRAGSARISA